MNRFQRKPNDESLENTIKNPMTPDFRRINEVGTRHTHTEKDYRNPMARALRLKIIINVWIGSNN